MKKKKKVVKKETIENKNKEHLAILAETVKNSKNNKEVEIAYNEIVSLLSSRIKNICGKFNIPGMESVDIWQEALMALRFKAIKDYDRKRGAEIGTAAFDRFAMLCIRRHLSTELKRSLQVRKQSLNKAVSLSQEKMENDEEMSLLNIIPNGTLDSFTILENKEYFGKLSSALMAKLSLFEKDVFFLYLEKYTYDEISNILNEKFRTKEYNIKGVDNALSRIKSKALIIFKKFGDNR